MDGFNTEHSDTRLDKDLGVEFCGPNLQTHNLCVINGALFDRMTHHVHILEMNGKSYRLAQSRSKRKR